MEHGQYVNPGNSGFQVILNSEYIDKTGLIGQMNSRIGSSEGLVCVSRPRRFGKSYAAKMLCAYYDSSCDSRALFDGRAISKMDGYAEHMNSYNVICFDATGFLSDILQRHGALHEITTMIPNAIQKDLVALYPYLAPESTLADCLLRCVEKEEKKFIFIIDEWDAVIREAGPETQRAYLNLLRGWFKNISFTPKVVAAAYLTGILPIKKDGSQSAISDFIEYPILYPDGFAEYTGKVAQAISEIRDTQYAPTFYNDEQSLRYVVKFAYVAAVDQYMKIEELPSGHGIADIAYIPKRRSPLPALIVELKWNKSAEGAIGQIKDRNYPAVIREYEGAAVLVGINYDPEKKEHTCEIERLHI